VSFASEPERDDGSLPPVNIVIPDDARELDRDVLAYRREMRALRRRQRRRRLLRPFNGPGGGAAAIVPLLALCLAIALVGGSLLAVLTTGPTEQDSTLTPSATPHPTGSATALTTLPAGSLRLEGRTTEPVRSLVSSAIVLVPDDCECGPSLVRLAGQAHAAGARVFFVGSGAPSAQLVAETAEAHAVEAEDADRVLTDAYHPAGLTVLLVFSDATAEVRKNLAGNFQLGLTPGELNSPGARTDARPSAQADPAAHPTAGATAG
jgi:hypothetical protein